MIQLDSLAKVYPPNHRAVDGLSLTVNPGEVYGLLGPNGAGKTTTLRMILGLLKATSGDVTIDGIPVSQNPQQIKRLLGLVSASAGLYQWLSPRETLWYFGRGYGMPADQLNNRIDELCELLDLAHFIDQKSATLSTGQKQRVNLARALIHDPPVILMDEPTRGLDIVGTQIIFEYIALLREQNKSIIVCTHQLDEAERYCDRFGLLHRGKLHCEGTLEELKAQSGHPALMEVFLELLNQETVESNHA